MLQDLIGDLSGTPQPIEVKVFGADQATIEASAREIAERCARSRVWSICSTGSCSAIRRKRWRSKQTTAERYGLSAGDLRTTLRSVVEGTVATELRVGDRLLGVRVRYPNGFHQSLDTLGQTLIDTPGGGPIPLSAVATLRFGGERTELDRERLRPVVHVTARIEGTDLGTAMARIKRACGTFRCLPELRWSTAACMPSNRKRFINWPWCWWRPR